MRLNNDTTCYSKAAFRNHDYGDGYFHNLSHAGFLNLVASGFSPTTSTTAHFTPYAHSAYELTPSLAGDAAQVASRTFAQWVTPGPMSTPGGFSVFATRIDFRKALACGGASHATDSCGASPIETVGMNDARFASMVNEMYHIPTRELQKHNYPYTSR